MDTMDLLAVFREIVESMLEVKSKQERNRKSTDYLRNTTQNRIF